MGTPRKVVYERTCKFEECGSTFTTTDNRKIYCSRFCAYSQCNRNAYKTARNYHRRRARIYRAANPELIRKANQRSYWGDPEFHRRRACIWAKLNPDKANATGQRRRVIQAGSLATLTEEQWVALKKAWGYKCAYCNCTPTALTQDHVVPVTKGGEHTISNIVPACQSCNSAKGNRDVVEFALALEKGLLKCKRQH